MIHINRKFIRMILPVFFMFNAMVYFTGLPEISRLPLLVLGGMTGYAVSISLLENNRKILMFILCTLFFGFISKLANNNISLGTFLATFMYMGMSLILLKFKVDLRAARLLYWGLTFIFFCFMVTGVVSSNVLHHVSRNYISVLMLTSLILLYIVSKIHKKNITVVPPILFFAISFWAVGRGGILTSGIFLAGVLMIEFVVHGKYRDKRYLAALGLIVAAFLIVAFIEADTIGRIMESLLRRGFTSSSRTRFLEEYTSNMFSSVKNFIFGPPISTMSVQATHGGNFHNSFIQMHAYFGIFYFIAVIAGIGHSLAYFFRQKDYISVVIILSLMIRASTDRLFFSGYSEPFLFYYLFYPFYQNKPKSPVYQNMPKGPVPARDYIYKNNAQPRRKTLVSI